MKSQQPRVEQLVRQQSSKQEASLQGAPRPWGSEASSALPGSAEPVMDTSILPVPRGQWYIATWLSSSSCKASTGLAEMGEKAWVPGTQVVWMARLRGRWLLGALASEGGGGKEHAVTQRPLLCKDSGGCRGAMCCPDHTDQSLADWTCYPATSASSGA